MFRLGQGGFGEHREHLMGSAEALRHGPGVQSQLFTLHRAYAQGSRGRRWHPCVGSPDHERRRADRGQPKSRRHLCDGRPGTATNLDTPWQTGPTHLTGQSPTTSALGSIGAEYGVQGGDRGPRHSQNGAVRVSVEPPVRRGCQMVADGRVGEDDRSEGSWSCVMVSSPGGAGIVGHVEERPAQVATLPRGTCPGGSRVRRAGASAWNVIVRGHGVAAATCSNRSYRAEVRIERGPLASKGGAMWRPAGRGRWSDVPARSMAADAAGPVSRRRPRWSRFLIPGRAGPMPRARTLCARARHRNDERPPAPTGAGGRVAGHRTRGEHARCRVHAAHRGNEVQRVTGCTSCHRWMAANAASQGRTCTCTSLPILVRQPPVWALTIVTMSWDTGCRRQRWRRPA